MVLTVGERRFREGLGVQFLENKKIRCQGISRKRMRQFLEEDPDLHKEYEEKGIEVFWPECQCHLPATPGGYMCGYHGGKIFSRKNPRTVLDVVPIELAEKIKMLEQNGDYINRKNEILILQARIMQLLEETEALYGDEGSWEKVEDALEAINRGSIKNARLLLLEATEEQENKRATWDEFYKAIGVLKDLTNTQVKTARELRQMITTEQLLGLISGVQRAIFTAAEKHIHEPSTRNAVLQSIGTEIARLVNASSLATLGGNDQSERISE